jgi:hypothetical protein
MSAPFNVSFTGITSNENSNVKVYPNPSNDGVFNITLGTVSNAVVRVYNVLGETLLTKNINSKTTTLDLSYLKTGCYFVSIANGKENQTKKLVISK